MRGEENGMERPEMWHVFADSKGERSCSYGLSEALVLNEQGEVIQFCKMSGMEGETEIPLEEWTAEEFGRITACCLAMSGMERLQNLPAAILQAMRECGTEKEKAVLVMRKILDEIMNLNFI